MATTHRTARRPATHDRVVGDRPDRRLQPTHLDRRRRAQGAVCEHARARLHRPGARPGARRRHVPPRRRREALQGRRDGIADGAPRQRPSRRPSDVDVAELEGELLVDAVVANQLRSQLTPVEEALACRRLKTEYGLTLKGIAQRLQMTQARVRDRLQILQLPEALWPRVSAGEIPVGAIAALVALAKIAPGLAEAAVTLVARPRRRLRRRAVHVARRRRGCAERGRRRPARRDDPRAGRRVRLQSPLPAQRVRAGRQDPGAAGKLAELLGKPVDALELHFDHATVEQARALKAAHTPRTGG